MKRYAKVLWQVSIAILTLGYLTVTTVVAPTASAIDQSTLNSIDNGTAYYDPNAGQCSYSSSSPTLSGSDNPGKAFNYFSAKGLSKIATAAVVGNLYEESAGVNPTIIQNPPGGTTSDPSWITGPKYQLVGWGIAQWTPGAKAITIEKTLGITGPIDSLSTQLDMVWGEMTGTSPVNAKDMVTGLEQTADQGGVAEDTRLTQAVEYFRLNFEGGDDSPARLADAKRVLQQYGPSATGGQAGSCGSVQCGTGDGTIATGVSALRQSVVCIARQQLALWTPPPGPGTQKRIQLMNTYTDNNINDFWCADFVSWVYKQAGDPFEGIGGSWRIAYVPNLVTMGKQNKGFHWHDRSGYTPRPGDIAIWNGQAHTNLVTAVTGSKVTFIGGDQDSPDNHWGGPDSTSVVDQWVFDMSNPGIDGYISPDN